MDRSLHNREGRRRTISVDACLIYILRHLHTALVDNLIDGIKAVRVLIQVLRINGKDSKADLIEANVNETEAILHHLNQAALEEVGGYIEKGGKR